MTTIEETIRINARPQVVWLVFSEIDKWSLWNPICLDVSADSEGLWRPGERFSLTIAADAETYKIPLSVVETKSGKYVRWRTKRRGVTGEFELTLDASEGSTMVKARVTFKGWLLPLMRLTVPLEDMEKLLRVWLDSLRRESERRARELREVI